MKWFTKTLLVGVVCGLCFAGCAGTPAPAGRLVSLDEAAEGMARAVAGKVPPGAEVAVVKVEASMPWISALLMNKINSHCVSQNLTVLERNEQALTSLSSEQQFQMSGLVDDKSAAGIGHYWGADAVITGSITRYARFSQLWLRAVDVETAELLVMYEALIRNDDPAFAVLNTPLKGRKTPAATADALDYLSKGKAYYWEGKYDGAIGQLDRALGVNSKLSEAYYYRGAAYYELGDFDKAIADYNRALRIDPDYADAYSYRGNAYYGKKDYDKAIADYTRALRIDPDYAYIYRNRGRAYRNKKDYDRAIADYTQALRINPDYADAYFSRGLAYDDKGEYDQAIADYTQALEIDPDYANAYNNRGVAYHHKKDYDKAIADYEAALRINPDVANARNNLTNARRARGN